MLGNSLLYFKKHFLLGFTLMMVSCVTKAFSEVVYGNNALLRSWGNPCKVEQPEGSLLDFLGQSLHSTNLLWEKVSLLQEGC